MEVNVKYDFLPKTKSVSASMVQDHFGIDFETGSHVIAKGLEIDIQPADVVLFNGSSGSGKSSVMRFIENQLKEDGKKVLNIDEIELPEKILVEGTGLDVTESMQILTLCGLSEAQLMLRYPKELSDGQRYRYKIALALAQKPDWIVADEFTATLDRTLAKVIAYNIRRNATRSKVGFLLATTHDDFLEDLQPDIYVLCDLSGKIEVTRAENRKKKVSALKTIFGSAKVPKPIGRTSLGGITGVTT